METSPVPHPSQARDRLVVVACVATVLLAMVLVNPRAEMGISDDWSYVWSARQLARTGHLVYNGWSTAMLGVQLYLGALFARLFGESFLAIRASCMALSALSAPIAYALGRQIGLAPLASAVVTLALLLSPINLPGAVTFMSDGAAMFFLLVFFHAGLRAVQSSTTRRAILWLLVATLSGAAAGSIRQIAWMAPLCSFPALAWLLRKRRGIPAAIAALWTLSAALTALTTYWFQHQQYVAIEKPYWRPQDLHEAVTITSVRFGRAVATGLVVLWPVLAGIALRLRLKTPARRIAFTATVCLTSVAVLLLTARYGGAWWGDQLLGDRLTTTVVYQNFIPGILWPIVPAWVQALTAFLTIQTAVACAFAFYQSKCMPRSRTPQSRTPQQRALLWMTLPFAAAYLVLVFTRFGIFDRYFIPIYFLGSLILLMSWQRRTRADLSPLCLLPLLLVTGFAVATMHDRFSATRARLAATQQLQQRGIPRDQIYGGFEFDAWTQIDKDGYVDEPRIHPASAFHPQVFPAYLTNTQPAERYRAITSDPRVLKPCHHFFFGFIPAVHGRYTLLGDPGYCFEDAGLPPVPYTTWLGRSHRAIYTAHIPQAER